MQSINLKIYTVYALFSKKLERLYIGQTENLARRLEEHNTGLSQYTSRTDDWKLFYNEKVSTRTEAMRREKQLKSQKGREFLRKKLAAVNPSADGL